MDPISVIPVPPKRKWQQFGIHVLPKITFGATLLAVIYLWTVTVLPRKVITGGEAIQAQKQEKLQTSKAQIARLQSQH